MGGGVRHATNIRLKSSGVLGSGFNTNFDNSTGGLVEVEYMFSPQSGMKVRYAQESYKASGYTGKLDGNHVGLFGNFYF